MTSAKDYLRKYNFYKHQNVLVVTMQLAIANLSMFLIKEGIGVTWKGYSYIYSAISFTHAVAILSTQVLNS